MILRSIPIGGGGGGESDAFPNLRTPHILHTNPTPPQSGGTLRQVQGYSSHSGKAD